MSSRVTTDPSPPTTPGALPPRPPRPLIVHFGVDSAVAFLALVVLGLIFGVPWGITAVGRLGRSARSRAATPTRPRCAPWPSASSHPPDVAGDAREIRRRELGVPTARRAPPCSVARTCRSRGTAARSHFYALFVAVVAAVVLVATAPAGLATFGAAVYAIALVGMFGAERALPPRQLVARHREAPAQLDHTAIFLMIAGTYTPDRAARDRRHRAHSNARRGVGRRRRRHRLRVDAGPRATRVRDHRVPVPRLDRRASRSSRCTTRPAGRACSSSPAAGCCYTIGAIVHAARRARSVARDVRVPRDLPRVRDPRRAAALLRDRLLRAPARLVTCSGPRTPEPRVLGRRRRRLPGCARATRSSSRDVGRLGDPRIGARACSATSTASTSSSSDAGTRAGRCTSPATARAVVALDQSRGQLRHAASAGSTRRAPRRGCVCASAETVPSPQRPSTS